MSTAVADKVATGTQMTHCLTAEFATGDPTRTLLEFAAVLHRRRIHVVELRFIVRAATRVQVEARIAATGGQARTVRLTLEGRPDVLGATLTSP